MHLHALEGNYPFSFFLGGSDGDGVCEEPSQKHLDGLALTRDNFITK